MINDQSEIFRPAPRPTNHIGQSSQIEETDRPRPLRVEADGWFIEVLSDAIIVRCAGDATLSLRAGQPGASIPLGQTQIIIRRDPPANNSRATELIK
jgi:hypothetical protein